MLNRSQQDEVQSADQANPHPLTHLSTTDKNFAVMMIELNITEQIRRTASVAGRTKTTHGHHIVLHLADYLHAPYVVWVVYIHSSVD